MDTWKRSWAKSITWRILGIILLFAIAWVLTGDIAQTTTITVVFHGIRVVLYVFHERAWERIKWGRR